MTAPTIGQWVQYNVSTQSPNVPQPSTAEQTIGLVRQAFTAQGKQYFQVVWNPGSRTPKVGMYTEDQLCPLDQNQANNIINQLAAGTYQPTASGSPSSQYQQPNIPVQAAPPSQQPAGMETL